MTISKDIKQTISNAWDFTGISAYFYGIGTSMLQYLSSREINGLLSNVSLTIGIIWVTMNIYEKVKVWRNKKADSKKKPADQP